MRLLSKGQPSPCTFLCGLFFVQGSPRRGDRAMVLGHTHTFLEKKQIAGVKKEQGPTQPLTARATSRASQRIPCRRRRATRKKEGDKEK